ncbi:MAG: ribonuclease HI [Polyangiaceae bacterium]|nr:ribonuclease HI [Polyangiaceae bacterium]
MPEFTCAQCGRSFEVAQAALDKYPGWTPRRCLGCRKAAAGRPSTPTRRAGPVEATSKRRASTSATREEDLPVAEVLARYSAGPDSGVFTDGAADPNPGPGGWGAVYVVDNRIVAEKYGHEPHTTNNRMELVALAAGIELVPSGTSAVVFSDSELCVKTFNEWAQAWQLRGWKRKAGPIKNLDLVQRVFGSLQERPELELRWIPAHSGYRWNEYADALATAYRRTTK